jgi:hypothetical protein
MRTAPITSSQVRRKSTLMLTFLAVCLLMLAGVHLHAAFARMEARATLAETRYLVERWRLTDLCLLTEARYTRHPSQADRHSPFQDHPLALEHFPSGTLFPPPAGLRDAHETVVRETAVSD